MEWSHALFFMAEPIRAMEGIYWVSKSLPILHRRPLVRYILSLLSRHGTIRRSAVFCLICCGQSRPNMAGFYATAYSVS